jgi:hypothetical protein
MTPLTPEQILEVGKKELARRESQKVYHSKRNARMTFELKALREFATKNNFKVAYPKELE